MIEESVFGELREASEAPTEAEYDFARHVHHCPAWRGYIQRDGKDIFDAVHPRYRPILIADQQLDEGRVSRSEVIRLLREAGCPNDLLAVYERAYNELELAEPWESAIDSERYPVLRWRLDQERKRAEIPRMLRKVHAAVEAGECERETAESVAKEIEKQSNSGELERSENLDAARRKLGALLAGQNRQVEVPRACDIERRQVEWIWRDYIPKAKITLLYGQPGVGKSFLSADLAARMTTGGPLPDGSHCEPTDVWMVSAEDDYGDTIVPRLEQCGADLTRVYVGEDMLVSSVEEEGKRVVDWSLTETDATRDFIRAASIGAIVVDPISAYLTSIDTHKEAEVRQIMKPLTRLANETGVSVLMLAHMNKGGGGKNAIDRVQGSTGIIGNCRAAYLICKSKEDSRKKLMLPVKNNLAPLPWGLSYEIEEGRIRWHDEQITDTADEILRAAEDGSRPQRDAAKEALREFLADGPKPSTAVWKRVVEGEQISRGTLFEAKRELGIEVSRVGNGTGAYWQWTLPGGSSEAEREPAELPDFEQPPAFDAAGNGEVSADDVF